jgi:ADP-heptose:LPS heptosyltransferase
LPGILVLQLKRIGDAVLTAPLLGALRAAWPDQPVHLVLAGAAGDLGPLFTMAGEVLTWKPGGLNLPLLHRIAALRPKVVLDLTGTDRSALLALISGAPVRAGYAKFAVGPLRRSACNVISEASVRQCHTIDFHHALARAAGLTLPPRPDAGHLQLPAGLVLPALPDQYLLIHPGTAREEKFWPARQWSHLLDHLHRLHGLPLVMTGGDWEFERTHLKEILSGTTAPVLNLRGRIHLQQLAGVIARARLVISVDTAAMHLAASFGVPQVAMFGPTNPFHWAPRHARAVVLQAGLPPGSSFYAGQTGSSMAELAWPVVAQQVDQLLDAAD